MTGVAKKPVKKAVRKSVKKSGVSRGAGVAAASVASVAAGSHVCDVFRGSDLAKLAAFIEADGRRPVAVLEGQVVGDAGWLVVWEGVR